MPPPAPTAQLAGAPDAPASTSILTRWLERQGVTRVVRQLAAGRLLASLAFGMSLPVLPTFLAGLPPGGYAGAPVSLRTGLLFGLFGLVCAMAQVPAGRWYDRRASAKRPLVGAVAGLGALFGAIALAPDYTTLLTVRTLQAVCFGMMLPAIWLLVSRHSPLAQRGAAIGFFSTVQISGFATGPLIGGMLTDWAGHRVTFAVCAALCGLSALVISRVPEPQVVAPAPRGTDGPAAPRSGEALILGLGVFAMMFSVAMIISLFPRYEVELQASNRALGFVFAAAIVSRLLLQGPLGAASDRIGRKPLIVIGLLLMMPANLLLASAASLTALVVARLLQGVCMAAIHPASLSLASRLGTGDGPSGRQLAAVTIGVASGVACGPLISGSLDAYDRALPFHIANAVTLLAAGMIALFVRDRRG